MKSKQLTKKQAVAILTKELSTQYLGLQILGLFIVLQAISSIVFSQLGIIINIIFALINSLTIYSIYKKTNGKILDLKKKYGVE